MVPQMYKSVGDRMQFRVTHLRPAIQESTKAVVANYTAVELITKRGEVKLGIFRGIDRYINKALQDKGIQALIQISNVAITDFTFSLEFKKSIEEKVKAEQDALRAQNEKEKRITQAEAAKKEAELLADAQAYAINEEAKAKAEG